MGARRLLAGTMANMRDLGGYPSTNGDTTKYMRFIRTDMFGVPSPEEMTGLVRAGLRLAIDLRQPEEIAHTASIFEGVDGVEYRHICFADNPMDAIDTQGDPPIRYVDMASGENRIGQVFKVMADFPDGAIAFHCSAGKDRTGIVAALLLGIAGVAREDIVADYQVTYTYIKRVVMKKYDTPGFDSRLVMSEPGWMEIFLDFIEESGGAVAFLESKGVSRGQIASLRSKLLGD